MLINNQPARDEAPECLQVIGVQLVRLTAGATTRDFTAAAPGFVQHGSGEKQVEYSIA